MGKYPSDWAKLDQEQKDKINALLIEAVRVIGDENHVTYVFRKFESGLIFALDAIDITNVVIQQLDSNTAPLLRLPQGAIATGVIDSERILRESRTGREALQKLIQLHEDLTAKVNH